MSTNTLFPANSRPVASNSPQTQTAPVPAARVETMTEQTCLILREVHVWAGRIKAREEDYKHFSERNKDIRLPEGGILSLGSKRLVDPARLRPFEQVRRQIDVTLATYGLAFGTGVYLVPMSRVKTVMDELDKSVAAFEDLKRDYLSKHEAAVRQFAADNPKFFKNGIPLEWLNTGWLADKFECGYSVCRFSNETEFDRENNHKTAEKASRTLFDEITSFGADHLGSKTKYTAACERDLEILRQKLFSMSFIDSSVMPVIGLLDKLLKPFAAGPVEDDAYEYVRTGMSILADRTLVERLADEDDLFETMLAAAGLSEDFLPAAADSSADDAQIPLIFDDDDEIQSGLWTDEDMEVLRKAMAAAA